ncbi:hypothetical protein LXL04_005559 [Taraxacum kok-saghyz]
MYTSKLLNLVVQYEVDGGVKEEIGLLTTFFDSSIISKASLSWQGVKFVNLPSQGVPENSAVCHDDDLGEKKETLFWGKDLRKGFDFKEEAAPHHHLERPVEAPTSSNSGVANPATDSAVINTATDSSSVSTGLDTPPDPEIHRGPLTLSQLCKHSTGENFSVLVFKTQRLFVTVPGTHPVLPLSQNLLNGLDFPTRSANIPMAPEFMFAK